MSFSDSTVSNPLYYQRGGDLIVTWTSSAPPGTYHQVYVDGAMAWHGPSTRCVVQAPASDVPIQIGAVAASDATTNFAASLPSFATRPRAELVWRGGRHLGANLDHFNVYQSPTAGSAISYTTPVDTVPAAPQGVWFDGAGRGGAGRGGAGHAAITYTWNSARLGPGVWLFAVKPADIGNTEGSPITFSLTVTAPPRVPAANPLGRRLTGTYNASTGVPTLTWLASPP